MNSVLSLGIEEKVKRAKGGEKMADYLVKALAYDGVVRAYAVNATDTVAEAQRRHETWHTASAALGRALVGTLLLGSTLKGEDKLTVKILGDGPAGAIIVDGNAKGEVKGYIQNPKVALPLNAQGKIDVRGAVGTQGLFVVIKDLGLKEPFTGQTPIVSGELGEDFTYYLASSEQIPSAVGLSVLVNPDDTIRTAGGFMLQIMPGASEELISRLEQKLASLPRVSSLLDSGMTPEQILETILDDTTIFYLETQPVCFKCDCNKDKFATALITLGTKELQEMIDEDHGAETVCSFCGNKYHFSEQDLQGLITEIEENK